MKLILMLAATIFIATAAQAQTNRTYNTNMQDQTIRQNERSGTTPDTSQKVILNKGSNNQEPMQQSTTRQPMTQREKMDSALQKNPSLFDTLRYPQYDTSKNNGHVPGGGSAATTDHGTSDYRRP